MGIKISVRGKEYDLETTDPNELEEVIDSLTPEEEEDVQQQIMNALGVDEDGMARLVAQLEDELEEDEKPKRQTEAKETDAQMAQQPVLPPIFLDLEDFDQDLLKEGIDRATIAVGEYTALVNAGMTSKQAYDFMMGHRQRAHEKEMVDKQLAHQLAIKKMEAETQLQINGLKHLLNEQ